MEDMKSLPRSLTFLIGNKMKNKAHLVIKDKQIILAAMKGIAKGDAPGELKLKLTKMITAMPVKG